MRPMWPFSMGYEPSSLRHHDTIDSVARLGDGVDPFGSLMVLFPCSQVDMIDLDFASLLHTFNGKNDTYGEYFGATLLSVDIQGENKGDLLIGAPMYSMVGKREVGRVYLYTNLRLARKKSAIILMAKVARAGARFGACLASIDLNADKFADVVVSAPFEVIETEPTNSIYRRESSGAIYIYYGSASGLVISSEVVS